MPAISTNRMRTHAIAKQIHVSAQMGVWHLIGHQFKHTQRGAAYPKRNAITTYSCMPKRPSDRTAYLSQSWKKEDASCSLKIPLCIRLLEGLSTKMALFLCQGLGFRACDGNKNARAVTHRRGRHESRHSYPGVSNNARKQCVEVSACTPSSAVLECTH